MLYASRENLWCSKWSICPSTSSPIEVNCFHLVVWQDLSNVQLLSIKLTWQVNSLKAASLPNRYMNLLDLASQLEHWTQDLMDKVHIVATSYYTLSCTNAAFNTASICSCSWWVVMHAHHPSWLLCIFCRWETLTSELLCRRCMMIQANFHVQVSAPGPHQIGPLQISDTWPARLLLLLDNNVLAEDWGTHPDPISNGKWWPADPVRFRKKCHFSYRKKFELPEVIPPVSSH